MDKDKLAEEIQELQKSAQERLNSLAQSDPVWCNIQGQIGALNRVIGQIKESPAEPEVNAKVKKERE